MIMLKLFQRGASGALAGSAIDLPMAAFAGASLAFAIYAMPADLLWNLVLTSRLPAVLSAAEPPLGATARGGLMFLGAAAAFLGTWLLLRALGRAPAAGDEAEEEEMPTPAMRLRRADAHPDAPPRAPIMAGRDFGEPFEPAFAPRDEAVDAEFEPLSAQEPLPDTLELRDEPAEQESLQAGPQVPSAPEREESVGALMERLEGGLLKRKIASPPAAAPEPEDNLQQEPVGHRLRSAIGELQKMAGRA
jgi:hypothetical protein